MIRELINFSKSLDDIFKNMGIKPKQGLHILIGSNKIGECDEIVLKEHAIYSNKMKEISPFLYSCATKANTSWMINANKCFEKGKGIHSCSPYCVAFKKIFFSGGGENVKNKEENKKNIPERINYYFDRSFDLFSNEDDKKNTIFFKDIFTNINNPKFYQNIINTLEDEFNIERNHLLDKIKGIKNERQKTKDKIIKAQYAEEILKIEDRLVEIKILNDDEYIIFYLDVSTTKFKEVYNKYLSDKLFNKETFNTLPDLNDEIYGVSGFLNSIDSGGNKPFWLHQTAPFLINNRISNKDANYLNELLSPFTKTKPNILPNPLPIFIFKEEIQDEIIGLFQKSGFTLTYQEIIAKVWKLHKDDFNNYYLMHWYYGKGLIIKDFDYVSRFEYEITGWTIQNHFRLKDFQTKIEKFYSPTNNVFDLEQNVFKQLIGNKFNSIDYFKDLDIADYRDDKIKKKHWDNKFYSYSKYRKSVYDYIYKSKKQAIDKTSFYDMVFSAIMDDLKNKNEFGIKDKLNIWYSLNSKFNNNKTNKSLDMGSKLKEYQQFISELAEDKADVEITNDEQFAFAAGQVIDYILKKSKAADNSYKLLEPYLQKSNCEEFKAAIANDFSRYKHENFSNRFKAVANDVLSYETTTDLKKLLPEMLSGLFSVNQLFPTKRDN